MKNKKNKPGRQTIRLRNKFKSIGHKIPEKIFDGDGTRYRCKVRDK